MKSLPSDATNTQVDGFIATAISLIYSSVKPEESAKVISIFLKFMKDDGKHISQF